MNGPDAKVISVAELREFAQYLIWLSNSMMDEFSKATARIADVNENWNDKESARFMVEFMESVKQISTLSELMEAYSQYVNKKCDILDLYHNS